jgi:hypothetical protein
VAYISGVLVDGDLAAFLDPFALGYLGLDVPWREYGDADLRPQLGSQRLVEPQLRGFAGLPIMPCRVVSCEV